MLLDTHYSSDNPISSILHDKVSLNAAIGQLKSRIIEYTSNFSHAVRIGLVGKVGNGKSSIANSLHMIFKGQFEYVCVVGSQGETSLTPAPHAITLPSTNLVVVDFFGWDNSERYESDLKYLIQGLVPENFKEGDTKRGTSTKAPYFWNNSRSNVHGSRL